VPLLIRQSRGRYRVPQVVTLPGSFIGDLLINPPVGWFITFVINPEGFWAKPAYPQVFLLFSICQVIHHSACTFNSCVILSPAGPRAGVEKLGETEPPQPGEWAHRPRYRPGIRRRR